MERRIVEAAARGLMARGVDEEDRENFASAKAMGWTPRAKRLGRTAGIPWKPWQLAEVPRTNATGRTLMLPAGGRDPHSSRSQQQLKILRFPAKGVWTGGSGWSRGSVWTPWGVKRATDGSPLWRETAGGKLKFRQNGSVWSATSWPPVGYSAAASTPTAPSVDCAQPPP